MIDTPATPSSNGGRPPRTVALTGGAGFIGTNLAHRLASDGHRVLVYDDLSRPGVEGNLRWLTHRHPDRVEVEVGCVTSRHRVDRIVRRADALVHLAAQVAVTTSLDDPREDFEVNLGGTLNLLEAVRRAECPPHLIFTSTNKVYGRLGSIPLEEGERAYRPREPELRSGIPEEQRLDFHSPYGCSKGGADQYVLDYARSYDLPTTVFRMSCIYGPHQHGTEDQGWVAHFLLRALRGEPITIFGDGKQVRDILHVSDLVDAFVLAMENRHAVDGRAFNVGGGAENAVSLLEVLDELGELHGQPISVDFQDWRTGDQRWYVSDTTSLGDAVGWAPRIGKREGLGLLYRWLAENAGRSPSEREAETHPVALVG